MMTIKIIHKEKIQIYSINHCGIQLKETRKWRTPNPSHYLYLLFTNKLRRPYRTKFLSVCSVALILCTYAVVDYYLWYKS